jgi:hypothetical protein
MSISMRRTGSSQCLPTGLALLLVIGLYSPLRSQETEKQAPPKLNIVVVGGSDAINNIRQRTARETIVQVEDENHRPVAGAAVVFTLPTAGPGGTFANGSNILTAITNQQGRAIAAGFKPNSVVGNFQIRITASHQGMTGSTTVSQSNVSTAAGVSTGKLIAILAIAGGVVGGVIAAKGSEDNPVNPPTPPVPSIVLSPGSPVVTQPR